MSFYFQRERKLELFFLSLLFSSFWAFGVFWLFQSISLYALSEKPANVVEIIELPEATLAPKPQSTAKEKKLYPRSKKIEKISKERVHHSPVFKPSKEQPDPQKSEVVTPFPQSLEKSTPSETSTTQGEEKPAASQAQPKGVSKEEEMQPPQRVEAKTPTVKNPPSEDPMLSYYATIKRIIDDQKRYPEDAKRRGEEGTLLVRFKIEADGSVSNVAIINSSGSRILDRETIRLIKSLRFPPPPGNRAISLNMEIEYSLKR